MSAGSWGKAEHLPGKANPRFIVTSLPTDAWPAQTLYEQFYCARGEMENRINDLWGQTRLISACRWKTGRKGSILPAMRRAPS